MITLDKIANVKKFEVSETEVFILLANTDLKKYNFEQKSSELLKTNISNFVLFNGYLFCQQKSDSDIIILESNGKEACRFEGAYNLCHKNQNENEFLLITCTVDTVQQLILVDSNLDLTNLASKIYGYTNTNKWIYAFKDVIYSIDVYSGKQQWQFSINDFNIQDFTPDGSKIFTTGNFVLIESNEKKLLCMAISTGEFKWLNESIASGWSLANGKLYGTYGKYIVEIDLATGNEIRNYSFENSSEMPGFNAMYKLWASKKRIVCVDTENEGIEGSGVVRILNTDNFDTMNIISTEEMIIGTDSNVQMVNDYLCLLDFGKNLHILLLDDELLNIKNMA